MQAANVTSFRMGSSNADTLLGTSGKDTLSGRGGDDVISAGTSVRSPVRRSLISTVPDSASALPTTTMVGTPMSSASLNFTPGLTFPVRAA